MKTFLHVRFQLSLRQLGSQFEYSWPLHVCVPPLGVILSLLAGHAAAAETISPRAVQGHLP